MFVCDSNHSSTCTYIHTYIHIHTYNMRYAYVGFSFKRMDGAGRVMILKVTIKILSSQHACMRFDTFIHMYIHTYISAYIYTDRCIAFNVLVLIRCTCTNVCIYMYTCAYTYTYTRAYTYTYTYTCAYTHAYTYTCALGTYTHIQSLYVSRIYKTH
jgi:hypothetical protein